MFVVCSSLFNSVVLLCVLIVACWVLFVAACSSSFVSLFFVCVCLFFFSFSRCWDSVCSCVVVLWVVCCVLSVERVWLCVVCSVL